MILKPVQQSQLAESITIRSSVRPRIRQAGFGIANHQSYNLGYSNTLGINLASHSGSLTTGLASKTRQLENVAVLGGRAITVNDN